MYKRLQNGSDIRGIAVDGTQNDAVRQHFPRECLFATLMKQR